MIEAATPCALVSAAERVPAAAGGLAAGTLVAGDPAVWLAFAWVAAGGGELPGLVTLD